MRVATILAVALAILSFVFYQSRINAPFDEPRTSAVIDYAPPPSPTQSVGARSREVRAADYGAAWPFARDAATLTCDAGALTVRFNAGARFALNDAARAAGAPALDSELASGLVRPAGNVTRFAAQVAGLCV